MSRTGLRVDKRYMEESQRHPWPTKRTHELTIYTGTFPAKVSRTTQLIHRLIRNNKWCCQRHRIWGVVCYTALVNTLGLESKTQKALDYKDQKTPLNCKEQELGIKEEEKEMATHSSILVWKTPWMEKPGGLQSMELRRVGHDWATLLYFRVKKGRKEEGKAKWNGNSRWLTFNSKLFVTLI